MDKEHVFFENYAGTWDQDRKENPEILSFLIKMAGISAGDTVLDVGSGTGILLPYLHQAVTDTGRIEELDYSHRMLEQARLKFASLPGVMYTEKNILKYKLPQNTYDVIVCLNFYPHIAQYKEVFIKKMTAALKQDGSLIIMHDMPRSRVNSMHDQGENPPSCVLPPVDIMATMLITAGLTVTVAMDTESFYFIRAEKKQYVPYEQYPEHAAVHEELIVPEGERHGHSHGHDHGHVHLHTQTRAVMNRLARISGHLEAIKRMVEDGRDCSDILIQISAVDSALVSVGKVILRDHIDHCIVDAVKENDMEAVDNLKKAITTFIK